MSPFTRSDSYRLRSSSSTLLGLVAAAAISLAPAPAGAQAPPAAAPAPAPAQAPGYPPAPAPGGYYQPPPGGYYAPPPGAYYPPPGGYYAQPIPPREIEYDEGQTIPPGYHKTTKIRTGLVVGGAVLFGVLWLTSASIGAVASDVGSRTGKLLIIPAVGPFTLVPSGYATADLFLVLDGICQIGGIAMLVAGLAAQKTVLVRDIAGLKIQPTPMTFGAGSGGFGFRGTF